MTDEKVQMTENLQKDGTEYLAKSLANMKGIPTEKELTNLLNESIITVTFNKLDGEQRIMTCTKSKKIIPAESLPKTNNDPKQGTITVWDVNARGWRSFKYDRVTEVK